MSMESRIPQEELNNHLWNAAVLLRTYIDAGSYKQYIFPLLFFKRLSDVYDEETAEALEMSGGDEDYAALPENHSFEVPEGCTAVGIRAHDFAPCAPGAENALPVELLSASENPFDWNLIFQLPDGTTRLWWKVSKTTLSVAEPDAPACLSALPERVMALVEHK
jgi:hypothetical protein